MPVVAHPLSGRVALVTGVSRREGIGFAVARRLAELGARVAIQGLPRHDAEQHGLVTAGAVDAVLEELRAVDPDVCFLEADFADPAAAARVVADAAAARGGLDILVANHARSSTGSLDDVTAAELDLSFAVNTRGSVLLAQAFARSTADALEVASCCSRAGRAPARCRRSSPTPSRRARSSR